jgi:hypothetical protein
MMALDFGFTYTVEDVRPESPDARYEFIVYSDTPLFGKVEYARCSNELKAACIVTALTVWAQEHGDTLATATKGA